MAGMPKFAAKRGRTSEYYSKGMRRVRLLLWFLFRKTPMDVPIVEWVERGAARHCKLTWEEYCNLKRTHPEQWERWALKRERARQVGHWPKQPPQLRRARKILAQRKALFRKERPRFQEWAMKKLLRPKDHLSQAERIRETDRLLLRLVVPRAEYRRIRLDALKGL